MTNISVCPKGRETFMTRSGMFTNCPNCGIALFPHGVSAEEWEKLLPEQKASLADGLLSRISAHPISSGNDPAAVQKPTLNTADELRKDTAVRELRSISNSIQSIAADHHYMKTVLKVVVTLLLITIIAPIVFILILLSLGYRFAF